MVAAGDRMKGPDEGKSNTYLRRNTRIRAEDLEKHGYTGGCPGCIWYSNKIGLHRGHTGECRRRPEEAMGETEEGRVRVVEQAQDRKDRNAEIIEAEGRDAFYELCRDVI